MEYLISSLATFPYKRYLFLILYLKVNIMVCVNNNKMKRYYYSLIKESDSKDWSLNFAGVEKFNLKNK